MLPWALPAQVVTGGGRTQVRCAGQVVTEVVVRSESPAFGAALAQRPALGRAIARAHTTTVPEVIRNFVLLKRGDRCTPLRRSESERILRAMPFIADASVTAYQDGAGVRLEVVTVDEPSIVANLGIRSGAPFLSRVTLGNANLMGQGVYAAAGWREGGFYRDGLSGRYTNYQLFSRPYQLDIRGGRREVGSDWLGQVSYPFLTDVQRVAWRVSAGGSSEFARFLRPETRAVSVPLSREYMEAGAVGRFGRPGQLGLAGLQFTVEDVEPEQAPVFISASGVVRDTTSALIGRYAPWRSVRLNTLLGFRRVRFLRVTGFDALSGPQDLRTGIQVSTTIGRGLPNSRGSSVGEWYVGSELYAGVGTSTTFAAIDADMERRRLPSGEWIDLVSNGRAAWYLRPHPRHLLSVDLSWAAVRDSRIPVQLSLGDRRGGMRGFDRSWLAGGSRVVARAEERWRVANVRGSAAVGVAVFTDVGAVRAGDVPLGVSSGLRQSVGASLIVATPPRSQRMWRVDFALPTRRTDRAGFEIRMSSEDRTSVFWRVPNDILSARERVLPQSIFRWP